MIGTAADVWAHLVRSGLIQEATYDTDVADHLRQRLGAGANADVEAELARADWSARELIRALAPLFSSFSGMARDILALLERVDARSGSRESLRLIYDFDGTDVLDQSLNHFRESIVTTESVTVEATTVVFADGPWNSPLHIFRSKVWSRAASDRASFPEASQPYDATRNVKVPKGLRVAGDIIERYAAMIEAVKSVLATIGKDDEEVACWSFDRERERDVRDDLAELASDHWVGFETVSLEAFIQAIEQGDPVVTETLIGDVARWLDTVSVGSSDASVLVQRLIEVLSLPMWGKRHELYSVWILSQIDAALNSERLTFIVTDGALRLPFKKTLVAEAATASGPVELWSELRSDAQNLMGKGRKKAIQPDYRFTWADGSDLLLIEVKQYFSAASTKHAEVLHDYVVNTTVNVLVAGHGPLGDDLSRHIPSPQQHRAHAFPHVRPDEPDQARRFRDAVAADVPPPPASPSVRRFVLRWDGGVPDLDLHVESADAEVCYRNPETDDFRLRRDARWGGPETLDVLRAGTACTVTVRVFDGTDIVSASPILTIQQSDGSVRAFVPHPRLGGGARTWRVGHVDEHGGWEPAAETIALNSEE